MTKEATRTLRAAYGAPQGEEPRDVHLRALALGVGMPISRLLRARRQVRRRPHDARPARWLGVAPRGGPGVPRGHEGRTRGEAAR